MYFVYNKYMDTQKLNNLRHSCAHLLAAAVVRLWPDTKPTIGPAIEHGFYYDFDFSTVKISDADLPKIEEAMHELVNDWGSFERIEIDSNKAMEQYNNNEYKKELIHEFTAAGEQLTLYRSGGFVDLCRGGHCERPDTELKYFKLLKIAGAYWRGSEKNKMLIRIYGTCWPTKEELDAYLLQLEESKKRDHRKIGQDLDLFSTNPLTGQGLILWHPKLAVTRNVVEQFWKDEHYKRGYQLVYTPHIASMDMFVKSRHLSKYINSMFPVMLHEYIEGESAPDYQADEVLKPMNCPNHIQIFKHRPRSYRELPLRIGELGTVYRYERAGVLHGLTRVRGFTQDDSHIFCTPDQVIDEVRGVLRIMKNFYALFGFTDYQAYIATRPEKYLGSLQNWKLAEDSLKQAAKDEGFDYKIDVGEGVFYGPKIDVKVKDSLGREWQLGTVQFDFNQPDQAETTPEEIEEFWRLKTFKHKFKTKTAMANYLKKLGRGFDVTYVDADGKQKQCVMIHRVILGSLERFFGILIEHYAGAFPLWLAPVQIALIPIAERHNAEAGKILEVLRDNGLRVELDDRNESMQAKIRNHTLQKTPYLAIMGDREIRDGSVSVRTRSGKDLGALGIEQFVRLITEEIERKR
jgi:threonyl-tRNA synthetase